MHAILVVPLMLETPPLSWARYPAVYPRDQGSPNPTPGASLDLLQTAQIDVVTKF